MKVLYINNSGAGYADRIEVAPGTTVDQFFQERLPGHKAEDHLIRINRQIAPIDQMLQEGDRITITSTKVAGA